MITIFVQGESTESDKKIFGLIGHWIVSQSIHKQLGTAITSNKGDIWGILTNNKGDPLGFASYRHLRNKSIHLRFIYCEDKKNNRLLIERILETARKEKIRSVWTNDRITEEIWNKLGFIAKPKARSSFCRWEKTLQIKE